MTVRDPVCPACGEPVGSTSRYCMHCDAEFDAPADAATTGGEATDPTGDDGTDVGDGGPTGVRDDQYRNADRDDGGDGGLADAAWRLGGVALFVVVGLLSTVVLTVGTLRLSWLWVLVLLGGLGGVAVGGFVVYRRDVPSEALGDALYVTAAAVVFVPSTFFVTVDPSLPLDERATLAGVTAVVCGVLALPIVGLGWWLQPDRE